MSEMEVYRTFQELRDAAESNDSFMTVTMGILRAMVGKRKLGIHVVEQIREELINVGFGWWPDLTFDQGDIVRLYSPGPLRDLVEEIIYPSDDGNAKLHALVKFED